MTASSAASKPRRRKPASVPRVDAAPAFILHQYPYRETSKLLDVYSRDHGRVMVVARGAQRPGSQLRGVLLAFQPVLLSWFGAGEVKTLHTAEWQGGLPQLTGLPLLCGFYLNELLIKLLPRDDINPQLFVSYFEAIRALAQFDQMRVEPILRSFELVLIRVQGYAPDWTCEVNGLPVRAGLAYAYDVSHGITAHQGTGPAFDGQTLLDAGAGAFQDDRALAQGKLLMRQVLGEILGDAPLHTRRLLLDLQKL
ncbi:DNA repair protein RecO [Andreprevotia sp. IGB-42]|uniref:DNA repair protein RecO n=1 Tax=Andreprevotia sp. IGB-42 TaxID=2497473 RepID=UPI001358DA69|nr:DNA repair protein RecO [Andreprevotia sp. IGB-42]KAF0814194.1 DNA repair protein RecO [Andreprevotia sp. IGB-42]